MSTAKTHNRKNLHNRFLVNERHQMIQWQWAHRKKAQVVSGGLRHCYVCANCAHCGDFCYGDY